VAEACALALLPALVASIPTAFRTRAAGGGLLDGWVVGTAVWLCLLLPMALLRRRAARGWRGLVGADPPADLGIALALWTGLAVALLLLLGALLKSTTHHRGLGGAAFAGVGLGAVAGAAVITPRLLALRAAVQKRHVPKWVVAGITGLLALGPTILAATPLLLSRAPLGDAAPATSAAIFDALVGLCAMAVLMVRGLPALLGGAARVAAVALTVVLLAVGFGRVELSVTAAAAVRAGGGLPATVLLVLERWTDRDQDGYGSHFGGHDCDEGDPRRHPGAVEIPGDGVDSDCDGLDNPTVVAEASPRAVSSVLAAGPHPGPKPSEAAAQPLGAASSVALAQRPAPSASSAALAAAGSGPPEPGSGAGSGRAGAPSLPDIMLVTWDTVRASRCSAYGYERATTPNLAALAERGLLFVHAYSPGSSTQAGIGAVVAGRLLTNIRRSSDEWPTLAEENDTLAERLKRVGYATAAVTSFTWLRKDRGFGQGFDRFDESPFRTEHPERSVTGPLAIKAAREAYDELGRGTAPIFLWIHLFDAHAKYLDHDGTSFGKRDSDRYDGEIAFVDKQLGELMQSVERAGRGGRTLWVVHGANGEAFAEHGAKGHGSDLYDEMIRVPLVIAAPGSAPGRYEKHAVSTLDIAPTLLDLVAGPREGLDGVSLRPALSGDPSFQRPPVLAYASKRSAVIDWPLKLMARRHEGGAQRLLLFDLATDPDERRDVAKEHKDELKRLDELLAASEKATP